MNMRRLICRAPVELWGRGVRPGDLFSVDAATAAQLVERRLADVYADPLPAVVPHYSGPGDAFVFNEKLARAEYRAQFENAEGQA